VMAIYQSQLDGNQPVKFPITLKASGLEALRQAGVFQSREQERE